MKPELLPLTRQILLQPAGERQYNRMNPPPRMILGGTEPKAHPSIAALRVLYAVDFFSRFQKSYYSRESAGLSGSEELSAPHHLRSVVASQMVDPYRLMPWQVVFSGPLHLEELTVKLYCGIDLHSNNHYLTLIDETDRRILEKRLPNDLSLTLKTLKPYRTQISDIAVESTFNWYWLVDGLMEAGYSLKLVNTAKARQYEGLKHTDDRHDAFWLAHQMRLGILPTGHIYPKEQRAMRDLLRVRRRLVRQRTTHVLTTQSTVWRHTAMKLPSTVILGEKKATWPTLPNASDELGVKAHRAAIGVLNTQIDRIERAVLKTLKPRTDYQMLLSVNGIGPVIAWTIVLESGDLQRFKNVGHFASYARCVDSKRTSNEKKKGEGNVKNGNAYLAWAFFEAAHFAIRYLPSAKRFFERKSAQRNPILAMKALSHKIARACYYVMRDRVPFDPARLFG